MRIDPDAFVPMTESARHVATPPRWGGYVLPIIAGLTILALALMPWTLLSAANARIRPDLPWAALITLGYSGLLLIWLQGRGPPRRWRTWRRDSLRLWPPRAADADGPATYIIVVLLVLLYVVWIAMSYASPVPDLGAYTTTSYRWSMFLMGGIMAGVIEEVAFRGYMQTGLERHDYANAIWITSAVFALSHITQGIGALLVMAPGLFIASVLYGLLARRTGTIVPGMIIHVLGDLARVYFGVLKGDGSLLFAS